MNTVSNESHGDGDGYLIGKGAAWFAFAMTFALMLFDYIDRQVIVSLFPHIKSEWHLNDKELGSLVSIISIVVALGGIPIALLADRLGRIKSIVVMAVVWSLASSSCMFAANYGQLFTARAVVGVGEAGYGSAGAALISTLFPKRLRSAVLGAFFAAGSFGSVLGVVVGGVVAAKWGWRAAFGVVGLPGLALALLYLFVRDYKTVALTPTLDQVTKTMGGTFKHIFTVMARTRTLLWVCIGAALQMITLSTVWAWLPSYLNRFQGMAPPDASKHAALVILAGALGAAFWGYVVDRMAGNNQRNKLPLVAALCVITSAVFLLAFGGSYTGSAQFNLIVLGGFLMTCTSGVVTGIVIDVVHPGVRSTGGAVLSLFQNLFGLAVGPFLAGAISDKWGLQTAMAVIPMVSIAAAAFFIYSMRSYDRDVAGTTNFPLAKEPAHTDNFSAVSAA